MKSLSGNVELIKYLNWLGQGIPYSKLEELETNLCLQKQSREAEKDVILPSISLPCVPTTLAFDNIDILEETLSHGGTWLRVNGIIVQPQVSTASLPPKQVNVARKSRSINQVPLDVPEHNARMRDGPTLTQPLLSTIVKSKELRRKTCYRPLQGWYRSAISKLMQRLQYHDMR